MRHNHAKTLGIICAIAGLTTMAAAETFVVQLDGLNFTYDGVSNMDIDLTINTGDTVQWDWVSGFHNVLSGTTGAPDAGDLFSSGAPTSDDLTMFEYTFDEAGVFDYHCEIHGSIGMASFVTVVPAPSSALAIAPVGFIMMRRRR